MNIIKIELLDGDGDLYEDNLPRLIVVNVVYEGGKAKRFPYEVAKLPDLFKSLKDSVERIKPEDLVFNRGLEVVKRKSSDFIPMVSNSNTIEKGDIVKCVKINASNLGGAPAGTQFLVVGREYDVQAVIGANGQVSGYEVVEHEGDLLMRTEADVDEVELVRKKVVKIKKANELSIIRECPACKTEIPCTKKKGEENYYGLCDNCGVSAQVGSHKKQGDNRLWVNDHAQIAEEAQGV